MMHLPHPSSSLPSVGHQLRIGTGLSGHLDAGQAAEQVCERCAEGLHGAGADLCVLFFSSHHLADAGVIARTVRRRLGPACLVGVSAETVLGGEVELEGTPGVSLFAASLPGVALHPFRFDELPTVREGTPVELDALARASGMDTPLGAARAGRGGGGGRSEAPHRATFLFADPFSVPMNTMLPALSRARPPVPGGGAGGVGDRDARPAPVLGGMASAGSKPGENVLILDDTVMRSGGIGVSLSGPVRMDSLVSQGCRPFGPPLVVTRAKNHLVLALGGRPALGVLHEAIESLDEHGKRLLQRGVFIGRAVNEYKERFGRGDFLVRNVIGIDKESGALAVADMVRVGQTVQFHLRDAETASEDLALLLDGQKLHDPPAGALLFTCNGRGTRLFDKPHHDAAAVTRAFAPPPSAEEKAKGGVPLGPEHAAPVPLAGFFAAGEIGPIGDGVFLHGHTACLAMFRGAEAG